MHYNTLLFVIAFIKELVKHGSVNGFNEDVAAGVFSPVIMRKPAHEEAAFHGTRSTGRGPPLRFWMLWLLLMAMMTTLLV